MGAPARVAGVRAEALPVPSCAVVARVVVLGALGLAHFVVDRTHPAAPGVAARVHQGCSAGTPAGTRRSPARLRAPRPPVAALLPGRPAAHPRAGLGARPRRRPGARAPGQRGRPGRHRHALRPRPPRDRRRRRSPGAPSGSSACCPPPSSSSWATPSRSSWCSPSGCFLALRPPPRRQASARPHFALAGVLAFAAALTRPIGVLLVLAVAAELVRWWPRLGRSERVAGIGAVVAPFVGRGSPSWPGPTHTVGDWWAPLRVQLQSSHHGGLSDPFATLYHDATGVLHHHVGTALHVPWVLLALAMLVVCWRRLPAPYTLFAAGGPGHRRGRLQPRLVRALRPQRLPAVHGRRAGRSPSPSSSARSWPCWRPAWPGTRCWPSSTSRCPDGRVPARP